MKLYELKITLIRVENPAVWRKVLVKDSCNFADLHQIIQLSMGWHNSHLYHFILPSAGGQPTFAGPLMEDYGGDTNPTIHDQTLVLKDYLKEPQDGVFYEYDMGDSWIHEVVLEKVISNTKQKHPAVTKGEGACPPENCGGVPGYEELKEGLLNPQKEEYAYLLEWLETIGQRSFDPKKYNLKESNGKIADLFKYSRKKKASSKKRDSVAGSSQKDVDAIRQTYENSEWDDSLIEYVPQKGLLVNYSAVDLESMGEAMKNAMPWNQIENINPQVIESISSIDEYTNLVDSECKRILEYTPESVHINIENNALAHSLVNLFMGIGIHCFTSITKTEISLIKGEKKKNRQVVQFIPFIPL